VGHQFHEIIVVFRLFFLHFVEALVDMLGHIELSVVVQAEMLLDFLVEAVFSIGQGFDLVVHLDSRGVLRVLGHELLNHVEVLLEREDQLACDLCDRQDAKNIALLIVIIVIFQLSYCLLMVLGRRVDLVKDSPRRSDPPLENRVI
jgi:hypothetical protein